MLISGQSRLGGILLESHFYGGVEPKEFSLQTYLDSPYFSELLSKP